MLKNLKQEFNENLNHKLQNSLGASAGDWVSFEAFSGVGSRFLTV